GAVVAGTFSFLTGVVTSVTLLVLMRIGNGVGQLVNDPIHKSLLTDYYPPHARPRVFSVHQNATQLGGIVGAGLAGIVAYAVGWRSTFMILIVPIAITAIAAVRMHEPSRGAADERADGLLGKPEPFARATKILLRVPTLRRTYQATAALGAA